MNRRLERQELRYKGNIDPRERSSPHRGPVSPLRQAACGGGDPRNHLVARHDQGPVGKMCRILSVSTGRPCAGDRAQ